MLLIYKCHYKVIHRVWRNGTVFWVLLPSCPLSPPPCPSPLCTLLSPHSAHCTSSLTKAHKKPEQEDPLPWQPSPGEVLRWFKPVWTQIFFAKSWHRQSGLYTQECTQSQVGGWPHNPVRPVQPCSGMGTAGSSMADDALSQTPDAVGCRVGWDNFPNKTKKDKNKPQ